MFTCSRTDVNDVVRDPNGVLVVFDNDQRVAEVSQPQQRLDESLVVALVQTDRGLVQDVEDTNEPRTDLGCEPDPLRLSPGKRRCRPCERQVVEANGNEEVQPLRDLLDNRLGDRRVAFTELERAEEVEGFARLIADTTAMLLPSIVTARLISFNLPPPHRTHGISRMYCW